MSLQRLIIDASGVSSDQFKSICDLAPGQLPALQNFENYLGAISGGQSSASLSFCVGAVQGQATITVSSTGPTNGQTMTLLGVTFTAVTSGATGNQFNISATPATVAANMVAAFNGNASVASVAVASYVSGVVTIKAIVPGVIGNFLSVANVNLSNCTFSSFATEATGSDGTAYTLNFA
jgi:hypothetical protein